jgi:hypothetical protein
MNILKFFHIIHNVYFKQKHFIKRKYYSSEGEDLFLKKKLNLKKMVFMWTLEPTIQLEKTIL